MTAEATRHSTIAAVATAVAPAAGSVAIVRVSGPDAARIGRTLFRCPGQPCLESHRVLYGHVVDPHDRSRVDEALLLYMQGPRSFTGEDVVEFHCHGGLVCVQQVLELVLAEGASRAEPGGFSLRAFLNGRLDLTRAEAIADLVAARSRRAARMALDGVDGGLQQRIEALRQELLDQLAELEARLDFEDDLPSLDGQQVLAALARVDQGLEQLQQDARRGLLLRQGLKVAIVGLPNVGKSSLLNRLSRQERAIVTDLPGTTRDLLESELVIGGVPITLVDTAGIRETDDPVERIGIDRSRMALARADVIVQLFDLTRGWQEGDEQLWRSCPQGVPLLRVGNKLDLRPDLDTAAGPGRQDQPGMTTDPQPQHGVRDADLLISTQRDEDLSRLEQLLLNRCGAACGEGVAASLNSRQLELARQARQALARVHDTAADALPWDFWTIDLREAVRALGEITGAEISEAVLDRIFSRFCIGK
ncbi:MAG: tRNA uridine-5-carboxymethylaminomethyl(34) synthesis GTPase MnmE [Aphanocapsa feldmannii 277cV]|uniref:tRNA modification GTPase MnmE n=2 Tax=Aphanocapsa feldmannii TaxID=192050 RepID=A0A524RM88_9CHRO|nr:MAG: tRNA uridine-5-carboxymethylaminomethyl(34) synthesis GTPase MnmE [Aphanocapsa feldmannii 277cV]TGH19708.1 MAG: tRNA uridine-5-carboxymethylaminomethyl(34) synthesis GTPase MnmE [Aphanocapsa feldmannii 277cI]